MCLLTVIGNNGSLDACELSSVFCSGEKRDLLSLKQAKCLRVIARKGDLEIKTAANGFSTVSLGFITLVRNSWTFGGTVLHKNRVKS